MLEMEWLYYLQYVDILASILGRSGMEKIENIYGIPRGGLIPAVILSHKFDKKLITDRKDIDPKNTLIVDDISDTGSTFLKLIEDIPGITYTASIVSNIDTEYKPMVSVVVNSGQWVKFPYECKGKDR